MLRMLSLRLLLLLVSVAAPRIKAWSQSDPIESYWFNQEKTAKIQIYKARDGKFYGKITWLKKPTIDGKPKVDARNPDESKRNQPIIGLVILKGFTKDCENVYEDGTVYDPKNGKTYSCKITRNGNELDVRGYVGISLIGRTTKWTKAD